MRTKRTAPAAKSVTATPLNVWVLGRIANGRREFPNRIESVSAPHMRRCMKAGLVMVSPDDPTRLRLTEAGYVTLADTAITSANPAFPIPTLPYSGDVCR